MFLRLPFEFCHVFSFFPPYRAFQGRISAEAILTGIKVGGLLAEAILTGIKLWGSVSARCLPVSLFVCQVPLAPHKDMAPHKGIILGEAILTGISVCRCVCVGRDEKRM